MRALPGYEASQAGVIAEVDSVIAYRELPRAVHADRSMSSESGYAP